MRFRIYILFILFIFHADAWAQTAHKCSGSIARYSAAGNTRSDTIDILNYHINLDITDVASSSISGFTTVTFTPKLNNVSSINLDLLQLIVDSVTHNNNALTWTYNDTLLQISLPASYSPSDTEQVNVYYHGSPQMDQSGWGGFYFQAGYAFNLGVGFQADPHNYGRVWFPCFDNFVERSSYDFTIRTKAPKTSHCNGALISETLIAPDTLVRHWRLNEEIPTYLACVAVADYVTVNQIHQGLNGPIPIELAAVAADTTNLKNSFIHLPDAIDAYENSFGPYLWNKVGYSLVPFSSGAMEHASNIAYPRLAANGTMALETLMAHELSHHWWGDLATCETAEDMWINEGMATYSEHLFLEHVYGHPTYIQTVKENIEELVHYAHINENGYRAVSGIPHQYTYGDHVYRKGAAVAHTMRGYLGDSLFFAGLKAFLAAHQFTHVNSTDMMNFLTTSTGVNMTDFFDDWVFNGGWPHFYVDSLQVSGSGGSVQAVAYIQQRTKGASDFFSNVPMEITFMDADFNTYTESFVADGQFMIRPFTVPFAPVYHTLNYDNKIAQAVGDEKMWIKGTGMTVLDLSHANLIVNSVTDSIFLRVEHNWVGTDNQGLNPAHIRFSPNHFWRVDGVLKPGFDAGIRFYYDGRLTTSNGGGYFDHDLLGLDEDSVILMYRRKPGENWREHPSYIFNKLGSASTKFGFVETDTLMPGEYAFAYGDRISLGQEEFSPEYKGLKIYPNPTRSELHFLFPDAWINTATVRLFDSKGALVLTKDTVLNGESVDVLSLGPGFYTAKVVSGKQSWTGKVMISR